MCQYCPCHHSNITTFGEGQSDGWREKSAHVLSIFSGAADFLLPCLLLSILGETEMLTAQRFPAYAETMLTKKKTPADVLQAYALWKWGNSQFKPNGFCGASGRWSFYAEKREQVNDIDEPFSQMKSQRLRKFQRIYLRDEASLCKMRANLGKEKERTKQNHRLVLFDECFNSIIRDLPRSQ